MIYSKTYYLKWWLISLSFTMQFGGISSSEFNTNKTNYIIWKPAVCTYRSWSYSWLGFSVSTSRSRHPPSAPRSRSLSSGRPIAPGKLQICQSPPPYLTSDTPLGTPGSRHSHGWSSSSSLNRRRRSRQATARAEKAQQTQAQLRRLEGEWLPGERAKVLPWCVR